MAGDFRLSLLEQVDPLRAAALRPAFLDAARITLVEVSAQPSTVSASHSAPSSASRNRLLWIDDNPDMLDYEIWKLKEAGWIVDIAPSGREAVEFLASRSYRALLLDQLLPYSGLYEDIGPFGGLIVYSWLRGAAPPVIEPRPPFFDELALIRPLEGNRVVPVAVVSAMHWSSTWEPMLAANPPGSVLVRIQKPMVFGTLIRWLQSLGPMFCPHTGA